MAKVETTAKEDGASSSAINGPAKIKKKRGTVANLKPWQPGQSGNPEGRRPMPPEVVEALKLGSVPAAERLVALTQDPDGRIALTAIDMLQNRLYGRPTQSMEAQVTTTNVQQAHLQILLDLQAKREEAMKTIEGEVKSEQDPEQKT
jgi:hypothetical protein